MSTPAQDTTRPSARQSADSLKISSDHLEHQDVNEVEMKRVSDADAQVVDHFGTGTVYSPEERALVRRLDWHIMPILFAMYYMSTSFHGRDTCGADVGRQNGSECHCECSA